MFDHPARIDPHVIGHHVAGQPDPPLGGAIAQVRVGALASEVVGDPIVIERIGRRDGVALPRIRLIRSEALRSLPEPDQPESRDAPAGERVQLLVRDGIQGGDLSPVLARELIEPDVGALCQEHHLGHPRGISRERLRLVGGAHERRCLAGAVPARAWTTAAEPQMERSLLLGHDSDREIEPMEEVRNVAAQL